MERERNIFLILINYNRFLQKIKISIEYFQNVVIKNKFLNKYRKELNIKHTTLDSFNKS